MVKPTKPMSRIGKILLTVAAFTIPGFTLVWLGKHAAQELKNTMRDGQDGRTTRTTIWGDRVNVDGSTDEPVDVESAPRRCYQLERAALDRLTDRPVDVGNGWPMSTD